MPRVNSVVSVYGMMDREDSVEQAALPIRLGLKFLWRAHAGHPGATVGRRSLLQPAFADTLAQLRKRLHEGSDGGSGSDSDSDSDDDGDRPPIRRRRFTLPRALICCGSSDFLLPSSNLVHARLQQLGCDSQLRVYPGNHAFFGLPPGWTFHTCFENSVPCARDVLDFLRSHDHAKRVTPIDRFFRGREPVPRWEVLTFPVAAQIVILLPLSISAFFVALAHFAVMLLAGWPDGLWGLLVPGRWG